MRARTSEAGDGPPAAALPHTVSILSQALPEATSYTGRSYVTLRDVPGAAFRNRSGEGALIVFDGNAYVDCGNPAHLQGNPASSCTVEVWVKIQSTKGIQFIVAHTTLGREFFLRINEGMYEFGCWDNKQHHGNAADQGDAVARRVRSEDIGTWVHLAGVYDRKAGKWLLYRNGDLLDTVKSTTGPLDVDRNWTIGACYGKEIAERFFKGEIAEVRLWTVARKAEEIGACMYTTTPDNTQGTLGGYWRLNETEGTVARDSAPRKQDGTVMRPAAANEAQKARIAELTARLKAARGELTAAQAGVDQEAKEMQKSGGFASPAYVFAQQRVVQKALAIQEAENDLRFAQVRFAAGEPARTTGPWPINDLSALIRRQDDAQVESAFAAAQNTGYFNPLVFPRIRGLMTDVERREARSAVSALSLTTFKTFYSAGQHLVLQRNFSGALTYSFLPTPSEPRPRLILIEDYRLSSFLGQYGVGRPIRTFSLLPGEKTKLTVKVSTKTSTTTTESSSILDSYSEESASEFEKALSEEQSSTSSSSENFEAHAEVSGGASCSFGHVEASAGVSGGTNSAREQFGKSVANATSKHAAKASNNRNVEIKSSTEKRTEEQQETEVVREIQNINIGRTLNFVFRQMNQEYLTLLHLVDVRLGFTDGIDPLREVPLYEMDNLLAQVIDESRGSVATAKAYLLAELRLISDFNGARHPGFVVPVDETSPVIVRYRVNKDYVSPYVDPETGTRRSVPGIIVSAKSMVMRTNDVVVEAAIGESPALDEYATGLQDEEIRTKRLANERTDLENEKLRLDSERIRMLLNLVAEKDTATLKLYTQALAAAPVDGAPRRVISIWEPGAGVRLTD